MARDTTGGDGAAFSTLVCHLICPHSLYSTSGRPPRVSVHGSARVCCLKPSYWFSFRHVGVQNLGCGSRYGASINRLRQKPWANGIGECLKDVAIETLTFCMPNGDMSQNEPPLLLGRSQRGCCSCTRLALAGCLSCGWWRSHFRPVGALNCLWDGSWDYPLSGHSQGSSLPPSRQNSITVYVGRSPRSCVVSWNSFEFPTTKFKQIVLILVLAMVLTRASSSMIFHWLFLVRNSHPGEVKLPALAKIISRD